jgi:hypothetical protein
VVLRMSRLSGKIPRITIRGETGLCVTEEGWRLIQERYGHQISDEARSAVNAVTNKFLQLAAAEDDATSKAGALKRLKDLKDRTDSLQEAINRLAIGNPIREYVDEEIAFAYSISKYDDSTPVLEYFSTFERELKRFSKACQDTTTFLSNHSFWPAGGAWGIWIRQLTMTLDHHGLSTSARKDSDNAKSDKASQFVELVATLQESIIPELFRRSHHSKSALANAIHKARKYSKPLASNSRTRRLKRKKAVRV